MDLLDLFNDQILEISHSGEKKWKAQHQFFPPASNEEILSAGNQMGRMIPEMIQKFWLKSNGAVLFKNLEGAPWGWKITGTERYLENQHRWRRRFFDDWRTSYLLIGELVNPKQAVVWDGQAIFVLDDSLKNIKPILIANNFEEFFQKLHDTQGSLWWLWND